MSGFASKDSVENRIVEISFLFQSDRHKQECTPDKFACERTTKCIKHEYVCDGDNDCGDGSDEKNCSVVTSETVVGEIRN